ncbi:MAG: hypothetical protein K2P63_04535 [Lachnospiraceae bacterium]|nr:hypothetical protein [Lachnospiraceae bacterium]
MDAMREKQAAQIVSTYIEGEMTEYRKVTEKELRRGGVAPEAKAAFNRKPYYDVPAVNFKKRPVLR